jgi:hypothetical protein
MFNELKPLIKIIGSSDAANLMREKLATFTPEQFDETFRQNYGDKNFFDRIINEANKQRKPSAFESILNEFIMRSIKEEQNKKRPSDDKKSSEQTPEEVRIDLLNLSAEDIQNLPKEDLENILKSLDGYHHRIQSSRDMVWNLITLREQENHNTLTETKNKLKEFISNANSLVTDVKIQLPEIDKAKDVVEWLVNNRLVVLENKAKQVLRSAKTLMSAIESGIMDCEQPAFFVEEIKSLENKLILIEQTKQLGKEVNELLIASGY